MTTFGIVTAVSRAVNLPAIHRSLIQALEKSKGSDVVWVLVIDEPGKLPPEVDSQLQARPPSLAIWRTMYPGGRCIFGIAQKNMGIDVLAANGVHCYYHLLDDDNIVHPDFFVRLEVARAANPAARAFVFGQQRWDAIGNLVALPNLMQFGKVDNTMFAVDIRLIGPHRYDFTKYGGEDFHFFNNLYQANKDSFVFLRETLAYYNYLKHFPQGT